MSLNAADAQSNTAATPAPITADQFMQSDPRRIYARLRPDQRTAIAGEFLRLFRLSGDPEAQRFDTPIEGMLSPERVAELHSFARQHHPEILEQVREHPVTQAALAAPGAEVEEPTDHEDVVIREGDELAAGSPAAETAESAPALPERGVETPGESFAAPDPDGALRPGDATAGAPESQAAADAADGELERP